MRSKVIKQHLHELLPSYVNGTLNGWQKWLVESWLQRDSEALAEFDRLCQLRQAVQRQPEIAPSPAVLQNIRANIQASAVQPTPNRPRRLTPVWLMWAAGLVLAFTLLWQALPPGIVLEWLVQGSSPQQFLVYRAQVMGETAAEQPAEADFVLLDQIPVADPAQPYTFTDLRLVPGQQYVYRVVAVDASGAPAASQTIVANGLDALPGQIVLLSLVLLGAFGLFGLFQSQRPITNASTNGPLPV